MKRSLLFLLLLALFMPWAAQAQNELTVYEDGTNNNGYVPFYGLYADTQGAASECVIPSDELSVMAGGTITAMKFYITTPASEAWTGTHQVYLGEIDETTLTGITGPDAYSVVLTAQFDATGTELILEFDEPYTYGGGNLLIGTYVSEAGNWKSAYFTGVNQEENTGWYRNSATASGTAVKFLPKTTFTYTGGGAITCAKPKNLAVEYNGGTTATVTWTGDANQYNIDVNGTVTNNVTSPYTLTGLNLATTYEVKVQANCGGGDLSDWTSPKSFATDICTSEDQCNLTFVLTDTYGDSWNGNAIQVKDVETGIIVATLANQNLDGTNGEETQTVTLAVCDGRELEFSWVAGSYPGETQYTVTDINDEVIVEGSGAFETFTFTPNCTPVTCARPTDLAVTYEGGTTATVTWNSDASNFNIDVNGTVTNNVTSPYTLTNLELATTYAVMVQANCGSAGLSNWTNPVTFKTDNCLPENQCALTFVVTDSYGDGWNGAYIAIYDYTGESLGDLLASVTNENLDGVSSNTEETQTITLNFCDGQELAIIWTAGNYDEECSYTITDLNGDIVAQDDTDLAIAYTVNCAVTDCRKPTDFAATEIGGRAVVLSWTENGPATEWDIAYMSANDTVVSHVMATTNPFTLTDLIPETAYAAQVTPVCEFDKPSDVIYFTTIEACPKPSHLNVTAYPFSADVDWTGFAEVYDLEWAEVPEDNGKDPYVDGNWYYYDNGTYVGSVGLGGGEFHWGVMFPAGTYEGSLVSKVSAYDINAMVGTLAIYNDGDTAPANQISIQDVEFTGASAWVEFSTNAIIDPSKNVWIVFDAVDGAAYPIGTSNDDNGDANGRWVEISGTWYDMATVGVTGRANMLRAYFEEGIDPSTLIWNPVSGVTPPYTIDGLEPETTYAVRVKAICGGEDGESDWAMTTFTTPSACEVPNNLKTNDITDNSAMLSWIGYQDRFVLRYRTTDVTDPNAPATIILEANDVWEDGSGYMMLLDADTTAYGTLWTSQHYIMVDGEQYSAGDLPASYFDEFEYKIPTGANGSLNDSINIVVTGSATLQIPAGIYDYAIFNPTPGDRFWIAADAGEVPSAGDNFVFEPGVTYHFTMQKFGGNDGAALEVDRPMTEWIEEDIAGETEFELTGLNPMAYYEWQVRGENDECTGGEEDGYTEWSELVSFTTTAPQGQTIELAAGWNWVSFYKEITMDELKAAIIAANPGARPVIKSKGDGQTTYTGVMWSGALASLDLSQMYMIKVSNACTITLNGDAIDATTHPATIKPGANWIAYPFDVEMTIDAAFNSFATLRDVVKSKLDGQATKLASMWSGALKNLEPGKGYIYNSKKTTTETFTFPAPAKKATRTVSTNQECKSAMVIGLKLKR